MEIKDDMLETTSKNSERGSEPVWKYKDDIIPLLQNSLGSDYANNPTYQAILKLFEQAESLSEKFEKQAEEIKSLISSSDQTISNLKNDTVEFKEKINKELGLWRYFIIGALVVIGISFITLTIDTFWKRGGQIEDLNRYFDNKISSIRINMNDLSNEIQNLKVLNPYLK